MNNMLVNKQTNISGWKIFEFKRKYYLYKDYI